MEAHIVEDVEGHADEALGVGILGGGGDLGGGVEALLEFGEQGGEDAGGRVLGLPDGIGMVLGAGVDWVVRESTGQREQLLAQVLVGVEEVEQVGGASVGGVLVIKQGDDVLEDDFAVAQAVGQAFEGELDGGVIHWSCWSCLVMSWRVRGHFPLRA